MTDALWKKGVRVVSSACPLGHGVAETALGFTISASKNFYNLNASLHNGGWEEGKDAIGDLFDLTVGVISAGWAGAHYIELLQNFNVDVLLYDPFVSDERAAALGCKRLRSRSCCGPATSCPSTRPRFPKPTICSTRKPSG